MKKILAFFAAMWMTLSVSAASYGILVNGTTYYEATALSEKDYQERDQYYVGVNLQSGDKWCVYDATNKASFTIAIESGEGSAKSSFTEGAETATCNTAGCYDFYIKLKWEDNSLWVQSGSNCSSSGVDISGQGGGTEGGGTDVDEEDVNYYAIGWINGADVGETAYDVYDDNYLFVDGKLTIECQMGSYIAIKDHKGNFYYAEGATGATGSSVTLKWANGWKPCQKWAILEGTQYIIMRSAKFKGEIKLECVDKATYDAYSYNPQGIENTSVKTKAYKTIIDGQLRIIRGDKMFDATGRQL